MLSCFARVWFDGLAMGYQFLTGFVSVNRLELECDLEFMALGSRAWFLHFFAGTRESMAH